MAIRKSDAIKSLEPNAQFVLIEDEISEWRSDDIDQPTDSEITTEKERLQTEYDSKDYARARESAYPSLLEFIEAYTEKEIGSDSTKWDAYVVKYNKVRTDNPKPS